MTYRRRIKYPDVRSKASPAIASEETSLDLEEMSESQQINYVVYMRSAHCTKHLLKNIRPDFTLTLIIFEKCTTGSKQPIVHSFWCLIKPNKTKK